MTASVAQPQASRTGLICTIVVSLILNGLLAIGFFTQDSRAAKLQEDLSNTTKKYAEAVSGTAVDSRELPTGKGSIEVIAVMPNHMAECRIIHVEPNEVIMPGDLIANVVYSRDARLNFLVFGDFDFGRAAVPRGKDGKIVEQLVEDWGGQLQKIADSANPSESITPTVDFLVIGAEPQAPKMSDDETSTPGGQYKLDQFKKQLDAYRALLARAADYGIPVLNQNRFLYYTGYFPKAKL